MRIQWIVLAAALSLLPACSGATTPAATPTTTPAATPVAAAVTAPARPASSSPVATQKALFAGGCFWCTESDFEKMPGVISAVSGYTGGKLDRPSYEQVSGGNTGHTEAVEVSFDPAQISYAQLVEQFWRTIDPTVKDQQFCDHGSQYRSGIYPLDATQLKTAEASKAALIQSGKLANVYTEVLPASTFWPAEAYHQDYYKTNAVRYKYYRYGCGRDARLKQIWGTEAK